MELSQIKTLLDGTGLPVAYRCFPEDPEHNLPPPLPWICYVEADPNNLAADGKVYYSAKHINIELYSKDKDPTSEAKVEAALDAAGIFWTRSETYLDDEKCNEVIYEIEV